MLHRLAGVRSAGARLAGVDLTGTRPARLLLALALVACGEAPGDPATSTEVTRSTHPELGVPVVTSGAGLAERDLGWEVSAEPELVLGAIESGPEAELFSRIAGAKQRSDGTIVVVEGGYGEIRRFDTDGVHLGTTGGLGGGPAEYHRPSLLVHPDPAAILIWDRRKRRLTRLDAEGEIERAWAMPQGQPTSLTPVRISSTGDTLVTHEQRYSPNLDTGPVDWPSLFSTLDMSTGTITTFDSVPFVQYQTRQGDGAYLYPVPLSHNPEYAAHFDHLIVSRSHEPEVHLYRTDGSVERIVRVELPAEPVSRNRLLEYERSWPSAEDSEPNPGRLEMMQNAPLPERVAEFDRILVDATSHIWIRRQPRVPVPDSSDWMVFAPDDALLGTITLPASLHIYQIGPDFILGRVTNDLGVQQVARYGLTR